VGGGYNNNSNGNGHGGGQNRMGGGGMQQGGRLQQAVENVAVFPIKSLSPYQNKWTIKARVVAKSDIRTYTNQKGEGRIFSVTFADQSGEIRATGFNDAVTAFYDLLAENQVYYVSKAPIKVANKKFSGGVNNEYEMTLEPATDIRPCEETGDVPKIRVNRVMLSNLTDFEKDATIDVVGVVREVQEPSTLMSKTTSKPLTKRDILICDESNFAVRVTLWGRQAETFNHQDQPVIALKGARVGDFGGRCLSMGGAATMQVNPDMPEAHQLRGWYDSEGHSVHYQTYSQGGVGPVGSGGVGARVDAMKTILQITEEGLGHGEKPDWFALRGTICFIRDKNLFYAACGSPDCNKKAVEDGDGSWRCEKCNRSFPNPTYRYIASVCMADHTGQSWFSLFNEQAEQLFGKTANEMAQLQTNDAGFKAASQAPMWSKLMVKVRAKAESYQSEDKVRLTVQTLSKVDFKQACADLDQMIAAYGLLDKLSTLTTRDDRPCRMVAMQADGVPGYKPAMHLAANSSFVPHHWILFHSCGINRLELSLSSSVERPLLGGGVEVSFKRASLIFHYTNHTKVICDGGLLVKLNADLKIETFTFDSKGYAEMLPRKIVNSFLASLVAVPPERPMQFDSMVGHFGIPAKAARLFEVAEVTFWMHTLIDIVATCKVGPKDALRGFDNPLAGINLEYLSENMANANEPTSSSSVSNNEASTGVHGAADLHYALLNPSQKFPLCYDDGLARANSQTPNQLYGTQDGDNIMPLPPFVRESLGVFSSMGASPPAAYMHMSAYSVDALGGIFKLCGETSTPLFREEQMGEPADATVQAEEALTNSQTVEPGPAETASTDTEPVSRRARRIKLNAKPASIARAEGKPLEEKPAKVAAIPKAKRPGKGRGGGAVSKKGKNTSNGMFLILLAAP
ncbi:Replication factor A protein 1, partial [Irineochytrium annulatum]